MRFGICCLTDKAEFLEEVGYDFIELPGRWVAGLSEKDFEDNVLKIMEKSKVKPEAINGFVPDELKITGPNIDEKKVEEYYKKCLKRLDVIGIEPVTFGSPGARNVPDGFPMDKAWEQLKWSLNTLADLAEGTKIVFGVEHLNRVESNILNSIEESLKMADEVNRGKVQILADLYHLGLEHEPLSWVAGLGERLVHTHVADGDERFYPGSGDYDFKGFNKALEEAGYDKRVSVECNWRNFEEEAPKALKYLKGVFK